MKNNASIAEEGQFITKEFAEVIDGKVPSPYLRLHDPVQHALVEYAASMQGQSRSQTAYCDRMIHFWREVSLAGLPRAGRGLDECYALLFESAFELAEAEPEWALECFASQSAAEKPIVVLTELARHVSHCGNEISHANLVTGFTMLYAPLREREEHWHNELSVALLGHTWFWAAILCAVGINENDVLWGFRSAFAEAAANGWRDDGWLHLRLIREAARKAQLTSRAELMAHPILRLARLKYSDDSVQQKLVLRFLNARCIAEGFESEEHCLESELSLARWVRDARAWAEQVLRTERAVCAAMFEAHEKEALESLRAIYRKQFNDPTRVDDLDAAAALLAVVKRCRGYEFSRYRAELCETVVHVVHAALWLGWLYPRTRHPKSAFGTDDALAA